MLKKLSGESITIGKVDREAYQLYYNQLHCMTYDSAEGKLFVHISGKVFVYQGVNLHHFVQVVYAIWAELAPRLLFVPWVEETFLTFYDGDELSTVCQHHLTQMKEEHLAVASKGAGEGLKALAVKIKTLADKSKCRHDESDCRHNESNRKHANTKEKLATMEICIGHLTDYVDSHEEYMQKDREDIEAL